MVTLKQVTSISVSSPWSQWSTDSQSGRGSVINPSYPIFIFDYGTSTAISVGYVIGSSAYTYQGQADANYFTTPALYLTPFGQQYAVGGGGVCAVSSCMENGNGKCGPWWIYFNLSSNSASTDCVGFIPTNSVTNHLQSFIIDFVNSYLLFTNVGNNGQCYTVSAIPLNQLSSFLGNTVASGQKVAYLSPSSSVSSPIVYNVPATLYNGYFIQPFYSGNNVYINYISLSTLYAQMGTSYPSTSSTPTFIGSNLTVYQGSSGASQPLPTTVYTSNGELLSLGFYIGSNYVTAFVNSSFAVANTYTFSISGSFFNGIHAVWNGVYIVIGYSGTTIYVNTFTTVGEVVSTTGEFGFASGEGYVGIASGPLSNSTVTWTIYQLLLDHTYVFQNVSISISGQTVTATGTLYDETAGSAVSGATVYLGSVNSMNDNYSGDLNVVGNGTTNSSGQFTITYSVPTGTNPSSLFWAVYFNGESA